MFLIPVRTMLLHKEAVMFSRGILEVGKAPTAKGRALQILLERRTHRRIAKCGFCLMNKIKNEKMKKKKKEIEERREWVCQKGMTQAEGQAEILHAKCQWENMKKSSTLGCIH